MDEFEIIQQVAALMKEIKAQTAKIDEITAKLEAACNGIAPTPVVSRVSIVDPHDGAPPSSSHPAATINTSEFHLEIPPRCETTSLTHHISRISTAVATLGTRSVSSPPRDVPLAPACRLIAVLDLDSLAPTKCSRKVLVKGASAVTLRFSQGTLLVACSTISEPRPRPWPSFECSRVWTLLQMEKFRSLARIVSAGIPRQHPVGLLPGDKLLLGSLVLLPSVGSWECWQNELLQPWSPAVQEDVSDEALQEEEMLDLRLALVGLKPGPPWECYSLDENFSLPQFATRVTCVTSPWNPGMHENPMTNHMDWLELEVITLVAIARGEFTSRYMQIPPSKHAQVNVSWSSCSMFLHVGKLQNVMGVLVELKPWPSWRLFLSDATFSPTLHDVVCYNKAGVQMDKKNHYVVQSDFQFCTLGNDIMYGSSSILFDLTFACRSHARVKEFHPAPPTNSPSGTFLAEVAANVHRIPFQFPLLVKTYCFDKIVRRQAHYCHKCSVPNKSYLKIMTECSAIELASYQFSQAHASEFYNDCVVHLGFEFTHLTVGRIVWVPCSATTDDAYNHQGTFFTLEQRGSNIILLEFYLDAFLLVLVQGSGLIIGFHIEKLGDPSGLISLAWHFQHFDGFISYNKIISVDVFVQQSIGKKNPQSDCQILALLCCIIGAIAQLEASEHQLHHG